MAVDHHPIVNEAIRFKKKKTLKIGICLNYVTYYPCWDNFESKREKNK